MRTESTLINVLVSLTLGFALIAINFVAQKIFVDVLGIEYLGLNGLFLNIISMLSIAELGIGSAIIYHLYSPLQKRDIAAVSSVLRFYKTAYRFIALTIIVLGLLSLPFLTLLVGENNLAVNIHLVYLLFIANAAASYLLSYKRSILYADQKNYLVDLVHFSSLFLLNALQIWILLQTHNYYVFLILKLAATIAENVIINIIVDKRYALDSKAKPIDKVLRSDIITKVKGLLFHKIAEFAVLGTDSIIISIFFGIKVVGLYSNYLLILTALSTIFQQLSKALTASVGNLLLDKESSKHLSVFNRVYFANFWISTVTAVVFFVAVNPFISLWLGNKYLFSIPVVAAITISLYLTMLRMPIQTFKTAAGIFHEDRFMPIIEAIINLVLSLLLLHVFGIVGVFIATVISTLFLHFYSYPKYTYSKLFQKEWSKYWALVAESSAVAICIAAASFYLSHLVSSHVKWIYLISCIVISAVISNIVLYILYRKTDEYAYFMDSIRNARGKIGNIRTRKKANQK